ncbi:unnamed protein product [Lupinus luteus]|uniref:non-specific serine/threonine protein kinase n=1 Tax=Lupinus luteus TaxID=3873 RepID=A0AAV1YE09_LUPLU
MNPIGFSFLILLSLSLVIAQERAPHGLAYENPEAFPPSAYNFFHPNATKSETKDPCAESKCSSIPLAAKVEATQIHQSNGSALEKSGKKLGAGVIVGAITRKIDGNNDIPTLTPLQDSQSKRPEGIKGAVIVGAIVASLIVVTILLIVYICLMRIKRLIRQTSETASSMPSPSVEMGRGNNSEYVSAFTPHYSQKTRHITILELEQATRNFGQSNIIGEGGFGLVYKGLLEDGSIVAIKRRQFALTPDFVREVKQITHTHHMHLVKLIGYYEDRCQQLLVYEYLPNGNVGNHLYDSEGLPLGRLDLWRRLSIALGAAKGLEHLHSLVPPLVHTNFRTRNVLLDENYTAKVSDYGFFKMQRKADQPGSSSNIDCFLDPELRLSQNYSEHSDVYSFGVFLLELISGCEAHNKNMSNPYETLVFQAKKHNNGVDNFVDMTLGEHEKCNGARNMMKLALLCVDVSYRRPSMRQIVQELEHIQREIAHLYSQFSEEIGVVTLGSELFQ